MSAFQQKSSFVSPQTIFHTEKNDRLDRTSDAKQDAPSRSDLERWYDILMRILDEERDGYTNHAEDIQDLRDEIYVFLY